MKLKLKNYNHNKSLSIREFVYNLLNGLLMNHATLTEEGDLWCGKNSWRSIRDVTYICKYYYPQSDYNMVKVILQSFGDKLVGHWCGDIIDWVVGHTDFRTDWKAHGSGSFDSFGNPIEYKSNESGILALRKYNYSLDLSGKDFIIK